MDKNVGSVDRIVRIVIGIAVMAAGLYYNTWWGLAGIVLVVTAIMNKCPLYIPCGLSTCKIDKEVKE